MIKVGEQYTTMEGHLVDITSVVLEDEYPVKGIMYVYRDSEFVEYTLDGVYMKGKKSLQDLEL
jgi:hypothetical protein